MPQSSPTGKFSLGPNFETTETYPVLLLVKDREQNREMYYGPLVLRESCSERLRHVTIGLIVTINDADDVLDGILLLSETLQTLEEK